jgi:SH3-like domain-containing protein
MATSRKFPMVMAAMLAFAWAVMTPVMGGGSLAQVERDTGPSGLPLPRFVSLKSDRVNVRGGPGWDHEISWVFLRIGLPVEIIAEYGNWRQIRDSEGAVGWVYRTLLSGRRTALVAPWIKGGETQTFPLHASASELSRLVARLGPAVLLDVRSCDGKWCRVATASHSGWIAQERLWGIYPNENVN